MNNRYSILLGTVLRAMVFVFVVCYASFEFYVNDGLIIPIIITSSIQHSNFPLAYSKDIFGSFIVSKAFAVSSTMYYAEKPKDTLDLWMNIALYIGASIGVTMYFWLPDQITS
jgi:hypothetical protein